MISSVNGAFVSEINTDVLINAKWEKVLRVVTADCINVNICTNTTRAALLGSGLNEQGTGENYMTSNFILSTLHLISLK
jgi:copper oxidase (laccase) domain-containing protein